MDAWPDDLDLQAWRQAYRELQGRGSPGCPPDERLIALVLHETQSAEREPLADHIVRCRRCTDLSRLLLRMHRDLAGTFPELAPSQPTTTAEVIVQRNGEREDRKAVEPPQQSTGPQPQRS